MLSTRTLMPEEVAAFGVEAYELNWGVLLDGAPVACFRAEIDGTGGLWVHANVTRRTLTPKQTRAFAKAFCEQLLGYGYNQLRTQIDQRNRAALRLVRAIGFHEIDRTDKDIVLHYGKRNQEAAVRAQHDL